MKKDEKTEQETTNFQPGNKTFAPPMTTAEEV